MTGTVLLPTNGSEPIPLKVEWVKDQFKFGFEVPIKKFYKEDDKCISLKSDDRQLLDNVKRNVLNKFNGTKIINCEDTWNSVMLKCSNKNMLKDIYN